MRWRSGTSTADVEDIRGSSSSQSSGGLGGGGFGLPMGKGGGVLGLLVMVVMALLGGKAILGGSPSNVNIGGAANALPDDQVAQQPVDSDGVDPQAGTKDFVTYVFNDTQRMWASEFAKADKEYSKAKLVLFSGGVDTGCGPASSAMGPFYCPADSKVYLDMGFYDDLASRFGASGDFAQAYVVAHEMGHHVQNVLGISGAVQTRSRQEPDNANAYSVRLELQADCLAGVWAYSVYQKDASAEGLDQGDTQGGADGVGDAALSEDDIKEGINAASSVGDDRIQEAATGRVDPESWTHGSAEQRTRWFTVGFKSGNSDSCDTFAKDI